MKIETLSRFDIEQYLRCLNRLSPSPESGNIISQFYRMASNEAYHIFVAKNGHQIFGVASLFIERKLSYGGCQVGHIEDVCVLPGCDGKGVGSALIEKCLQVAKEEKCRKVLLSCDEDNINFYQRFGFKEHEFAMRLDL